MKITKSQLKQIIKEELQEVMDDQLDEVEKGDFDPEADINLPGADPDEPETETEEEAMKLARLRDEIAGLLQDPDESDVEMAKDKLAGYRPKEED